MNFIRLLLLISLGFFRTLTGHGQGFLHTYGPDGSTAREVVQTTGGGYFLAGKVNGANTLFVLRSDAAGLVIWQNQLMLNGAGAIAACQASDGGFVVLAENYQDTSILRNIVVKVDANGIVQWSTIIHNANISNGLTDIIALSDGSFMAAGTTQDAGLNARNWLVKIGTDGSLVWEKIFGQTGRGIKRLAELTVGNIVVSGNQQDLYLAKVNENGDLLWEYDYPQANTQTNVDLIITAEGSIALLGTSTDPIAAALNICILKTDLNGNEIWYKEYYPFAAPSGGTPALPVMNAFTQDNGGNYYVPFWGFENDPFASSLELLKIGPSGNSLGKSALNVSGNAWAIVSSSDNHLVIAGDNNGQTLSALLVKTDFEGDYLSNKITGSVFRDLDVDCAPGAGETGLPDFIVQAQNQGGETFYKKTNPDGTFELRVSEGDFALSVFPSYAPATLYAQCDTPTVSISGQSQTVSAPPVAEQILGECPLLSVEIAGNLLRRCMPTVFNASWCNAGNLSAQNAFLQVVASPHLVFQSSTLPLSSQSGDTLTFLLGDILPGVCNNMNLVFLVDCDAQLNDVLCAEAHIFPDTSCAPPGINWDGSRIEVEGQCVGNEIEFKIRNTGSGNMTEVLDYVIIEDQIMLQQPSIQLNAGAVYQTIRVPMPEDSCFALQVFQNQTSILSKPVAVVANCTAPGNLNLLISLPNNENDPAVAVHCDSVIGSFDPNDKTGFPTGLTEAHYIERGQDIEYRIRFQNTGNDTAFFIRILDTLPATLDPASIRPESASHAFTWDISGAGILTFTFDQILLPDSNVNEPASHGFVSFRIAQKPGLTDETRIENTASIYFDFNDPVLTNTWFHTVGRPKTVAVQQPQNPGNDLNVLVSPNPVSDKALFQFGNPGSGVPLLLRLSDPLGKLLRLEEMTENPYLFKRNALVAGIYFWQIETPTKTLARGRIVVE